MSLWKTPAHRRMTKYHAFGTCRSRKKGGRTLANVKWHKKIGAILLAVLLSGTILPLPAAAEPASGTAAAPAAEESADTGGSLYYEEQDTYSGYYDTYADAAHPDAEFVLNGADYTQADCDTFEVGSYTGTEDNSVRDNVLIWDSAEGAFTYTVEVPETGLYSIEATYCPIVSNTSEISLSLAVDGEVPYDTASRMTLNKVYRNKEDIKTDSAGNQVRPAQVQTEMWRTGWIGDSDGLFNEPLQFYLEKGTHEITLSSSKAYFALDTLRFAQPEEVSDYDTYAVGVDAAVSKDATPSGVVRIEGEDAVYKSDSVLYPTYDNSTSAISPSDPKHMLYNTIGSGNWDKALQTITWQVAANTLPGDGWYQLGIKARQEEMRGFYSNRRISIDGSVPSEEFDQVKFYYDTDFRMTAVENADGEAVYVYLTAGEDHTITMEAIPGEIGDSMRQLDAIVLDLNTYYRKIVMITGPEPDKYTDYYVHEKLPELVGEFRRISGELEEIQGHIESLANSKGTEASSLEQMRIILEKCADEPLKIPSYLSQIKDDITSLSSRMRDYCDQPLEVDIWNWLRRTRISPPSRRASGSPSPIASSASPPPGMRTTAPCPPPPAMMPLKYGCRWDGIRHRPSRIWWNRSSSSSMTFPSPSIWSSAALSRRRWRTRDRTLPCSSAVNFPSIWQPVDCWQTCLPWTAMRRSRSSTSAPLWCPTSTRAAPTVCPSPAAGR